MNYLQDLSIAYFTYLVGTASPGPANFAIMQTSLEKGRVAGLSLAFGVITGSIFWGTFVAVGLGAVLVNAPMAFQLLTALGGFYLLWLGYDSFIKAIYQGYLDKESGIKSGFTNEKIKNYSRGLAIHLTNPKAVLVWTTTILLGTQGSSTNIFTPFIIVFSCATFGILIFSGYALIFSNKIMMSYYSKMYRTFTLLASMLFITVGLVLLYKPIIALMR